MRVRSPRRRTLNAELKDGSSQFSVQRFALRTSVRHLPTWRVPLRGGLAVGSGCPSGARRPGPCARTGARGGKLAEERKRRADIDVRRLEVNAAAYGAAAGERGVRGVDAILVID